METMLNTLFLCLAATAAVITSPLVEAGQICPSEQEQCCQNDETCCADGCCASEFSVCCSEIESCCSSNFPVCCPGKNCCPLSHSICCPDGCCPSNSICCPGNKCCPSSHPNCCGSSCCPAGYPVCCTNGCCPSGYFCCPQGCCRSFGRRSAGEISDDQLEAEANKTMFQLTVAIDMVPSQKKSALDILGVTSNSDYIIQHSIFSRQAATVTFTGTCNSYEREKLNEGYFIHVYLDPLGIRTIGVGFNLEKAGARNQIAGVEADYNDVFNNKTNLTDAQIRTLFNEDMNTAVSCAIRLFPQWFSLRDGPKSALADMAFNMGCPKLSRFKCLKHALARTPPDYDWAREEMRDSLWCRQVGLRCNRDIACMQ